MCFHAPCAVVHLVLSCTVEQLRVAGNPQVCPQSKQPSVGTDGLICYIERWTLVVTSNVGTGGLICDI